jgi:hypothetical protein
MKRFLYSVFLTIIFLFILVVIYLSTIGFETSKFNNLIIKEIQKKEPNIELQLKKIQIKLDLKKIQLFLSTSNPIIIYQNIKIPITDVEIFSGISKFLYSKFEINQITFKIKKIKIKDIQKIAIRIKPSNFKTYLINNLNEGELEKALIDLSFDKDFKLIDYTVKGSIKKVNAKIKNNFKVMNIGFNFITDSNLTLINSINADYKGVQVSNGTISLQKKKEIEIKGKFNTQFDSKKTQLNKVFKKIKFFDQNKIDIQGLLIHEFNLKIDNSFKVIDYNYISSGEILQSQLILKDSLKNNFIKKPVKKILFEKIKVKINFNKKKKNSLVVEGTYSTNNSNYKKFNIRNNLNKKKQNYFINIDLSESLLFDLINFRTNPKKKSNIKSEFSISNSNFYFKSIDLTEDKNVISIKGLTLNNKNQIEKISKIKILTFNKNYKNNDFIINFKKKITVSGEKYDTTNLLKFISEEKKSNILKKFSKEVEIKINNLISKSEIPLNNFNLIGLLEKGEFNKISAKSEFSEDEYLDISLKKDANNKKILEVYSDFPQALLSDYKFFEGIKDGTLLYSSVIDETGSVSKLTVENFKVIKAPAFATLLTLADFGGVVDLLSGQGMSFDFLEVRLKDDTNLITIEEILALGSSLSLHMEGYIEKKTGLVSLSGTIIPAKTLNRLISKIPIVGNVLVGSKLGEGVFGVSFKMKGLPGQIKTSVNPVKTITPRFVTRALEKMKKN